MTRRELQSYIINCIAMDMVVHRNDIGSLIRQSKDLYPCYVRYQNTYHEDDAPRPFEIFIENLEGSISYNGLYIKEINGAMTVVYNTNQSYVIDLGDCIDRIGECAFMYNTKLMSISSSSVVEVEPLAFYHCSNLRIARFPHLVKQSDNSFYSVHNNFKLSNHLYD